MLPMGSQPSGTLSVAVEPSAQMAYLAGSLALFLQSRSAANSVAHTTHPSRAGTRPEGCCVGGSISSVVHGAIAIRVVASGVQLLQ